MGYWKGKSMRFLEQIKVEGLWGLKGISGVLALVLNFGLFVIASELYESNWFFSCIWLLVSAVWNFWCLFQAAHEINGLRRRIERLERVEAAEVGTE